MNFLEKENAVVQERVQEQEEAHPLTALLSKPANLSQPDVKPALVFEKLESCCRGHYGYVDQFGQEYDLDYKRVDD